MVPSTSWAAGPRAKWAAALAVAACFAIGLAFWRFGVSSRAGSEGAAITFSVAADAPDAPPLPGILGEWVAADARSPRVVRFSDHSALQLAPGARMRVTTTTPSGADLLLERGAMHVDVAHERPTAAAEAPPAASASPETPRAKRWAVRAGPFEVRVTGTIFDAAWDPMAERFELTMIEGRVLVTGPSLPPERAVVGGERLIVSVRDGKMVLSSVSVALGNPVGVPQTPPGSVGEPVSAGDGASAPVASGDAVPQGAPVAVGDPSRVGSARASAPKEKEKDTATEPPLQWRDLAGKGRYRDAFVAAEAAGFSAEVERAPADDLLVLADAARFSGSPARAKEALLAARRRFGTRGQSAFLLGKIAADQQGSPGEAVTWFETYLREQPGGPLAEQALGRIVDLARRIGPDAAAMAGNRYLARYPDGSYAALARSLVAVATGAQVVVPSGNPVAVPQAPPVSSGNPAPQAPPP
jgi:hypothetical protein